MKYNILVAEDDKDIVKLLRLYLESDGYHVFSAENGVEALKIIENNQIDLAVLDIMMPKIDGYELTRKIREKHNFPIIFLSAKNEDSDKILGLNVGADDYMTKPFNPLEIIARIKSNLRRFYQLNAEITKGTTSSHLTVGEICIDTERMTVSKNNIEIIITPTEYKILVFLMKSPGRVYTKVQIYEHVKGDYFENDDNAMMVHISKLRDKIEDDAKKPKYIKTVRGLGYKIEDI